jgi:hypothetical protein
MTSSFIPVEIDINFNGSNIYNGITYYLKNANNVGFFNRIISITSYPQNDFKVSSGQISASSFFSESGTLSTKIEFFNINSSNGIYKNVTRIIINYENSLRYVYFIGKN